MFVPLYPGMHHHHRLVPRAHPAVPGFPPFHRFVTKGFVSDAESSKLLVQVVSDPSLTKSGVYWSWNKDSASFENQLSLEASDLEKARKLWNISDKPVGLA
ncbi:hypothetical protein E2562_016023 [Oryza meyeriana var. granulata]|uniref:Uncharacterized protein n=1 Tax=Oryza meyeriana var. granulata TaxID=110450 RepID=A0A6G1EKY1_9ORYZ|nr:hypothetical protein E2562_016023 [Oryza meyeriana var. granulata]